ncbi:YaeQ family protein [Alginatibacterium sediminis]|uniref:YaeQ family protein n=1 Tax=Alginatibacterium sediminis TaxID=2164068 RepID=A0A420EDL8_9ALTE|nr:YaeQ family protein [Alginatibacterium sediminis]RKF18797.1 YaeQ family protein [Alginatibacterium sediminis]
MALKPTIYKMRVALSDLERNYYDALNLTVAQHPSETLERMMARMLAYCIHAQENLEFTKGLSAIEEPDIWARELDESISLWIEVGEPNVDKIKKASRIAKQVVVYTFNSKSNVWWQQEQGKMGYLKAEVRQFDWSSIQSLAALVGRTMELSVTITGNSAYISVAEHAIDISWTTLQELPS